MGTRTACAAGTFDAFDVEHPDSYLCTGKHGDILVVGAGDALLRTAAGSSPLSSSAERLRALPAIAVNAPAVV